MPPFELATWDIGTSHCTPNPASALTNVAIAIIAAFLRKIIDASLSCAIRHRGPVKIDLLPAQVSPS